MVESQSHARARADRIRADVSIVQLLEDYGYRVRANGQDREQQFSCNLHGDGQDNKPSARVYPDSDSWYCFACGVSRDAIATVEANEGVGFWDAIKLLETKYNLPPLEWAGSKDVSVVESVSAHLSPGVSFQDDLARIYARLDRLTTDRSLPLDRLLAYWESVDKVKWHVLGSRGRGDGPWSESTGRIVLSRLQERLLKELALV